MKETMLNKAIRRVRKRHYLKSFKQFDITSAIGSNGLGKNCTIEGKSHISIGKDTYFGDGTEIIALENHFEQKLNPSILIGNHVRATARCRITCAGRIIIGNDVLMAPNVFITDHNHGMDADSPGGYSPQKLIVKDVLVGDGTWLGENVIVLPGVRIGEHSIIGAGSIVTHDIAPYTIAVGIPAKMIKKWNKQTKVWETINEIKCNSTNL